MGSNVFIMLLLLSARGWLLRKNHGSANEMHSPQPSYCSWPQNLWRIFSLDFEHSMQSQRSPSGEPGDSQKYVASSAPMLFLRMKTAAYEPADPPERIWSGLPMLTLLLRDVCFPHEYNQCEAELRWSCLLICCRNTTPSACHKQTQSSSTGNGFSTIAGNNIVSLYPKMWKSHTCKIPGPNVLTMPRASEKFRAFVWQYGNFDLQPHQCHNDHGKPLSYENFISSYRQHNFVRS